MSEDAEVETERKEMFEAIGKAINEWSRVERALSLLASVCLGPSVSELSGGIQFFDSEVMSAGLYAIDNFSAKLKFVEAILAARLREIPDASGQIMMCWYDAKKRAQKFSSRRNHLAHWSVMTYYPLEKRGRRVKLSPPVGSLSWSDTAANRSGYVLNEVRQLDAAFIGTAHRIGIVTGSLALLPQLRAIFATQIGRTIWAMRENEIAVAEMREALEFSPEKTSRDAREN